MVKCFIQILDKSKLVQNSLVNSRQTKLGKSKLVLEILSIRVIQNLTCPNLSEIILSIHVTYLLISRHGEMHQTNTRQV